jgi:ornithine--oxo-acid transaminase
MMNSIFRRINSQNVRRIFNYNFKQFSVINNETGFDLFGAKRITTAIKSTGAGNKVENVSTAKTPIKKAKTAKIEEPPVVEKPKRKKPQPVKEEVEEEEEVVEAKPKRKQSVSKATSEPVAKLKLSTKSTSPKKTKEIEASVTPKKVKKIAASSTSAASKKNVEEKVKRKVVKAESEEEPEEMEEEAEEIKPTKKSAGKKTPKKAAHTVHTLQTEPVKKAKVKQEPVKEEKKVEEKPAVIEEKKTTTTKGRKKKAAEEGQAIAVKKPRSTVTKKAEDNTNDFPVIDLNNPNALGHVNLDTPLDPKKYTTNPLGLFYDYINNKSSEATKQAILREQKTLCNNYAPLPVICAKGHGVYLQDIDGKVYIDFLSAYSAANQGHCNKNIIETAIKQMNQLYITSRAFYNNILGAAGEYISKVFNYEKIIFMNSGVEANETAIKIARRWGYEAKKIPEDQAKIVYAKGNFMGRTIHVCGLSDDPSRYKNFGPFDKSSHYLVEYDNLEAIKEVLEKDSNICAVFLEPIQGENGIIIPSHGYLKGVSELCKEKNVLFIADEIQTGCGRTGFPIYCDSEGVHADMLILGKSLSGGIYPVSAVLSSHEVMDHIRPGDHGSTYGGNPLAAHIAISAIHEMIQGGMVTNSYTRGIEFGLCLKELENNNLIKEIRGRGLMYGIELHENCGFNAYDFSIWLMERGVLCKPTRNHILR